MTSVTHSCGAGSFLLSGVFADALSKDEARVVEARSSYRRLPEAETNYLKSGSPYIWETFISQHAPERDGEGGA